jgi:hypothetical protein
MKSLEDYRLVFKDKETMIPLWRDAHPPTEEDISFARMVVSLVDLKSMLAGPELNTDLDDIHLQQRVELEYTLKLRGMVVGRTVMRNWEDREMQLAS